MKNWIQIFGFFALASAVLTACCGSDFTGSASSCGNQTPYEDQKDGSDKPSDKIPVAIDDVSSETPKDKGPQDSGADGSKTPPTDATKTPAKTLASLSDLETTAWLAGVKFKSNTSSIVRLDPSKKAEDQAKAAQNLADRMSAELPTLVSSGNPSAALFEARSLALKELVQDLTYKGLLPPSHDLLKATKYEDFANDKLQLSLKLKKFEAITSILQSDETATGRVIGISKKRFKALLRSNVKSFGKDEYLKKEFLTLSPAEQADSLAKIDSGIFPDVHSYQKALDEIAYLLKIRSGELSIAVLPFLSDYGKLSNYIEYSIAGTSMYWIKSKYIDTDPAPFEIATPVGKSSPAPAKSFQEEMGELTYIKDKLLTDLNDYLEEIKTIPDLNDPNK